MSDFPVPFAGINRIIYTGDIDPLAAIATLADCGHKHNFAVQMDANPPRIWTTELGAECLSKQHGTRPYEGEQHGN